MKSLLRRLLALGLLIGCAVGSQAYTPTPKDGVIGWSWGRHFANRPVGMSSGTLQPETDWMLNINGKIETDIFVPHSDQPGGTTPVRYSIIVEAYGTPADNRGPTIEVDVGHRAGIGPNVESYVNVDVRTLSNTSPLEYEIPNVQLAAGRRSIRIRFTDDLYKPGPPSQDRNLIIRKVRIKQTNGSATLPAKAGSFPIQSVSILTGLFGSHESHFGAGPTCDLTKPGCKAIQFAQAVGATDVTLTTTCNVDPTGSWCGPSTNGSGTNALIAAIKYAKSLPNGGLTVTLKPFVLKDDRPLASYPDEGWEPLTHKVEGFFGSMEQMLVNHATIAQAHGVSTLMIGAELGGKITANNSTNVGCQRWAHIINEIRKVAPSVKLTYSPTAAGFWNNQAANEAPYVCFWDKLDYIGINAYPHLNYPGANAGASGSEINKIATTWQAYERIFSPVNGPTLGDCDDMYLAFVNYSTCSVPFDEINFLPHPSLLAGYPWMDLSSTNPGFFRQQFNTRNFSMKWYADYLIDGINEKFKNQLGAKYPLKAIITEVGAPTNHNVHGYWGLALSTAEANAYAFEKAFSYVQQQARAWDGYMRAFRGDPRIVGLSIWGVEPQHDRSWTGYSSPEAHPWLFGYDFNAKPSIAPPPSPSQPYFLTEEAVCKWLKSTHLATCYGP